MVGIGMPRTRLAAAVFAAVVALLALAGSAFAHDEDWTAPAKIPKDDPERGMVYDGLKVASPGGACAGLLKVVGEPSTCTHGPDPAPPGVDVGDRQSIHDLAKDAE